MDLQDMRIFARVAAVQNLSSVGSELGLTPGTISKRIQALEEELSARLFDRTTRSIRITEEGATLLEHVERILAEVEHAKAAITANVAKPRGKLRIAAPANMASEHIAPAICGFMEKFEEIEVQIDLSNRPVNPQEDGYDVVIVTGVIGDSSLKAKRLASDPHVVVASPGYIGRHDPIMEPDDLRNHACLILGDAPVWSFVRGRDETSVRVSGRLRSDNSEVLRRAAIEGHGILRISESLVRKPLKSGALRRVLENYEVASQSAVWALYPSAKHVLPKLRVFLDYLAEWFKEDRRHLANGNGMVAVPISTASPKLNSPAAAVAARRTASTRR